MLNLSGIVTLSVVALAIGSSLASNSSAQEVTLPLDAYEALRKKANPDPPPTLPPPAPFAVERVEIEITAGQESAQVVERLTLSIYAPGWQTLPLPDSGNLTSVELGGLEGRVAVGEKRTLVARGVGRHVVRIDSVVPVVVEESAARPTRTLRIELPKAGIVTGVVRVGSDVREVELLSGGLLRGAPDGRVWNFVGAAGEVFAVRLLGESRLPDRAGLPLKFQARSTALAELTRTRLSVTGFLNVDVIQGQLDSLRLPVPKGLDVVRVEAGDAGWEVSGGSLVIKPVVPIQDRFTGTVFLAGESRAETSAPLLVPDGASRLVLTTGLKVAADGFLTLNDPGSSRPAEKEDLATIPASTAVEAYSMLWVGAASRPPRWGVEWSDDSQQEVLAAQADRLVVDTVLGESGTAGYQCWVVVRSSGAASLKLSMPNGFELASADRDGRPLTPGVHEGQLEIPLKAGASPQTVHLVGIVPFKRLPDDGEVEIPTPGLSVPVARVELRAVVPGDRDYVTTSSNVSAGLLGAPSPGSPFAVAEGYSLVEVSWTALSPRPAPLTLKVKARKRPRRWF